MAWADGNKPNSTETLVAPWTVFSVQTFRSSVFIHEYHKAETQGWSYHLTFCSLDCSACRGWWTDASSSYQPTDAAVENRKLESWSIVAPWELQEPYRSFCLSGGEFCHHASRIYNKRAIVPFRGAQTAALVAHQTPGGWQICRHARHISPAGKASSSELLHSRFCFFSFIASGKQTRQSIMCNVSPWVSLSE